MGMLATCCKLVEQCKRVAEVVDVRLVLSVGERREWVAEVVDLRSLPSNAR